MVFAGKLADDTELRKESERELHVLYMGRVLDELQSVSKKKEIKGESEK